MKMGRPRQFMSGLFYFPDYLTDLEVRIFIIPLLFVYLYARFNLYKWHTRLFW